MRLRFLLAVCGLLLRQEVIQPGTVLHLRLYERMQREQRFVSRLLFALTRERHWIKRHRF